MARKLDQRLQQLGALKFHERGLGDQQHDFGYEGEFDPWMEELWETLFKVNPGYRSEKEILPFD